METTKMLEWYKDSELGIFFDKIPNVAIRFATCASLKEDINDINKKPFVNNSELEVVLMDYVNDKSYEFSIKKGYKWDGATIPRVFWRLIGAKTDPKFLIPSLIHDVLCENHGYVDSDRYFTDRVFERMLYVSGVCTFNRWLMFHCVDNFQKFSKW